MRAGYTTRRRHDHYHPMTARSKFIAKANREWAASLDGLDRELFVAYNVPRLAHLHRAARRGDGDALRKARRLQSMLDACRKVSKQALRKTPTGEVYR